MFNFNNIRSIAAVALASASLLTSCVGLEEDGNDAVGYLDVPALEVDLSVDDLLLTKALDFEVVEPSVSDIHFVVKDKNGTVRYDGNGLWEEPLVLPVGSYSIEASYGSNGFDAPYFTGSAEGSIGHLGKVTPELTMKLSNSLVKVSVDSSLEGHFTPGNEVSFNDGTHTAGYNAWTYVPAGQDISVTLALAGTTSAGTPASFTHTLSNPSPKVAYDVVCGKTETNWPSITMSAISAEDVWASLIYITAPASFDGNISDDNKAEVIYEAIPSSSSDWTSALSSTSGNPVIKGLTPGIEYQVRARVGGLISTNVAKVTPQLDGLSVSAVHTETSGELDGTDVTSLFSKSDLVKSSIDSWSISLCKADGTVLRDGLSLGLSDGSSITATNGWPYLPTGNGEAYVLKASAVMDGTTYTFDDIAITGLSTPDFSLTMSSYTSYDKYAATNNIAKNVNEANSCDSGTLYNAGAKWGISTNLMKNTNYSKTLVIDIDGNKDRTYTVDYNELYENITGLGWSAHTLKVSMTFDNRTVSKTQTHHITGLPYRASPPVSVSTSSVYGWTNGEGNAQKWESGYLQLGVHGSKQVQTAYKDFYIPSTIDVSLSSKIAAHNAPVNTTCSIIIGSSTVLSVDSGGGAFNYKTTEKEETVSTQMTTSDYRVTLSNSYSVTSSWGRIYYVNILYR